MPFVSGVASSDVLVHSNNFQYHLNPGNQKSFNKNRNNIDVEHFVVLDEVLMITLVYKRLALSQRATQQKYTSVTGPLNLEMLILISFCLKLVISTLLTRNYSLSMQLQEVK